MTKKIVLNIEEELLVLDNIYRKYVAVPENLIFVKNNRYPLVEKQNVSKFSKLGMISGTPFHPFICIPTVIDVMTLYLYSRSENFELFKHNPLIKKSDSESFIDTLDTNDEEIVLTHVPDISKSDFKSVIKTLRHIFDTILKHANDYVDNIYKFDTESGYVILIIKDNIKAFRFDEYNDYLKYN